MAWSRAGRSWAGESSETSPFGSSQQGDVISWVLHSLRGTSLFIWLRTCQLVLPPAKPTSPEVRKNFSLTSKVILLWLQVSWQAAVLGAVGSKERVLPHLGWECWLGGESGTAPGCNLWGRSVIKANPLHFYTLPADVSGCTGHHQKPARPRLSFTYLVLSLLTCLIPAVHFSASELR